MWNKIIIAIVLSMSLSVSALFPNLSGFPAIPTMPVAPTMPKMGGFTPQVLQKFYNQFTDIKPDLRRENRLISEIEEAVMEGDVEYLPLSNNRKVFSIFMQSEAEIPKGGVIVLHSRGYHANWDTVIKPLRIGLTDKGWHTLSVQMPVLRKTAKYYDYVPIFPYSHERIEAAIDFYKARGIDNIILIAHGCGVHMTMSYFDKYGDDKINAYVGIGSGATDYKQKVVKRFPLDAMSKPVLDVYGERDFSGVKRMARLRKALMDKAQNKQNSQQIIPKSDHYYRAEGTTDALIKVIDDWLSNLK